MPKSPIKNRIQLLVFKDNLAVRHFDIPLAWLSRLGTIIGMLVFVSILSVLLTLKYYFLAKHSSPTHLMQLEQELRDLKVAYQSLESMPLKQSTEKEVPMPLPSATPLVSPSPIETLPDPMHLPFLVENTHAEWKGNRLHVKFNIRYIKGDNNSQQGKIMIFARGPNQLFTYPKGATQGPQGGEHFSVSRFRSTHASLGPVASRSMIQEIEILIFNSELKLLYRNRIESEKFTPLPNAVPSTFIPNPYRSPFP
jgi:hypothetical protein